ncbi:hypothetical protein PPOP_3090, partial [Paenibacillus popilliae ATCC 14706]
AKENRKNEVPAKEKDEFCAPAQTRQ